jgi:hypothetical protein
MAGDLRSEGHTRRNEGAASSMSCEALELILYVQIPMGLPPLTRYGIGLNRNLWKVYTLFNLGTPKHTRQ